MAASTCSPESNSTFGRQMDIGVEIARVNWRNGYAAEAILRNYCYDQFNGDRLRTIAMPARVAEE